jgi:hypothetical protein
VTAIAAGDEFTLALRNDGTVWAWGDNSNGQSGDGHLDAQPNPSQVVGLDKAPPVGSVVINGGAICASTTAVTLSLSASVVGGTVTQMRISNDGVFDSEPLETYTTTKAWTL